AEELGLTKHVLPIFPSDPAAKNRYLFVDGKLCALPTSKFLPCASLDITKK
ncbi:protoporphyrinogen oxidase, partial [Biomphalaria glabrata]